MIGQRARLVGDMAELSPIAGLDGRDIEMFRERAREGRDLAGAPRLTVSNLSIDLTHTPVTLDFKKV